MFFKKSLVYFSIICAFTIGVAFAAEDKPETPTTLTGGKVLTADEAKAMVDKKEISFFDTRKALNFGQGHLPGASSISYKEESEYKANFDGSKDKFELTKLPADKTKKIGFYSDGSNGWKSFKAATAAIKAGYTNVFWMRDGYIGWTEKKYPVEQ